MYMHKQTIVAFNILHSLSFSISIVFSLLLALYLSLLKINFHLLPRNSVSPSGKLCEKRM